MTKETTAQSTGSGITRRRRLWWELGWIPVEMAGVGLGLYLMLRAGQNIMGGFVLWCIVVASFLVRFYHYSHPGAPAPE